MRALILGCMFPALVLAQAPAPEPVQVDGKDLPKVAGPLVSRMRLPDLVGRIGNSDIDLGIRRSSRRMGSIPAVAVPAGDVAVSHEVMQPAGWYAYQVEAAPGETVKARVRADHNAWFVVRCVDRNGLLAKGMLQNLHPTGNPEASFINYEKEKVRVFFIVDTTEVFSASEPYVLTFLRVPNAVK